MTLETAKHNSRVSTTKFYWDRFWEGRLPDGDLTTEASASWSALSWQVALEYWNDVFKQLAPERKLLECGCGSAKLSQYMARRGYKCTMLDYSERGLNLARASFASQSLEGRFVIGDMHHLGLADEQFDLVYSGGALEFFTDIERPIREMVRVLRPGGLFATNVVPKKFSIQTVADIERTVVHSVRNLIRGRLGDAFKMVRLIPSDNDVSSTKLKHYVDCCEKAGLTSVTGLGTMPFPVLALPQLGATYYARVMKALLPQWRRFNQSHSRWTEIWGITYTVYGIKG